MKQKIICLALAVTMTFTLGCTMSFAQSTTKTTGSSIDAVILDEVPTVGVPVTASAYNEDNFEYIRNITFKWYVESKLVSTAKSYTPKHSELGKTLICKVFYKNETQYKQASDTIHTNLAAPKNLKLISSRTTAYLTWDEVKGASKYFVTSTAALSLTNLEVHTYYTSKTHLNKVLLPGFLYLFSVAPVEKYNGNLYLGNSDSPNPITVPAALKVYKKGTSATLCWSKIAGQEGYKVSYSTNSNMNAKKSIYVKGYLNTKRVMKGFTKGKTYYFQVCGYGNVLFDGYGYTRGSNIFKVTF